MKKQPWIYSSFIDSIFILSPPFICLLGIVLFYPFFQNNEVSVGGWVVLVLLIDVGHVYSTLYRTYFDKEIIAKHRSVLINIPIIALAGGIMLYEIEAMLFWRVIAYLAVFHFIRQQYGFMRIYSRHQSVSSLFRTIDNWTIYYVTLYPIIHWHTSKHIDFNWLIEGDFIIYPNVLLNTIAKYLYILTLSGYLIKELFFISKHKEINLPKNFIVLGTIVSWYFGIVYFNSDLIFTALNVVSHGIPYMALIWIYGKQKSEQNGNQEKNWILKFSFHKYGILVFLLLICSLAYIEETLWDGFVWRDHETVFPTNKFLSQVNDKNYLAFLIPLLSLPQVSHYLIDGYIWKVSRKKSVNEKNHI